jgi:hypothetical protein
MKATSNKTTYSQNSMDPVINKGYPYDLN